MPNASQFRDWGRRVIEIEKAAIDGLNRFIDDAFVAACETILACEGKVVVMGMGKSGHVGNKIAATLASTGTPAFFMHPGEASHGDLGMLSKADVVIAISNSGEAGEIMTLMPVIRRWGVPVIAMTGKPESSLAKVSQHHLCIAVDEEACPLGLAPTSSTTATLVMGDALAVALLQAKGFTADDFALSHPGGALGRKLLLRVSDLMHHDEHLPQVTEEVTISEALLEISAKGLGMTAVINKEGQLSGLFTDGDLRRVLDARVDIHETAIGTVMTRNPVTVTASLLAAEALKLMEEKKINGLIIVDESGRPRGALNMMDMLKAGVL
ncbi:KpsF/GutQ family sugar-phosphate isomerase [Ferrimonas balearica]|uniref:KpsF/GutQ family sugar-phosphate isomerase n=1 Tax=Ferrimonas balearica TaxID=44012 RepID=UPI001C99E19A|nr:KpsF/GutQ family sugar-phosphate isomerase [Ferrimonas balearica]MBY5922469.1 KpsF/GutQ family sugar-phosphate isomerase [Ferrimonas balearica]MBY5995453.1 KpsF/GutQ family sugar-phosphate isomerase [Ferrimonas balearica]